MEANELRIGNFVTIKNDCWPELEGQPLKVTGIRKQEDPLFQDSKHDVTVEDKDRIDYSQFEEFIWPIPLTEDILVKAGFEKQGLNKFWNDPILLIFYVEGCIYLANQRHVNIYYLHQLQNLYFALTGKELTIEL